MSADTPVLRLTCKEGYELLSDEVRFRETQDWLDEHLKPLLEALPLVPALFWGVTLAVAGFVGGLPVVAGEEPDTTRAIRTGVA